MYKEKLSTILSHQVAESPSHQVTELTNKNYAL